MDEKVKNALVCLLNKDEIISSWGINNISIEERSISFDVEGLIYKGNICIRCDKPDYEIQFEDGRTIQCSIGKLVDILDVHIETTDNYLRDLENWVLSKI